MMPIHLVTLRPFHGADTGSWPRPQRWKPSNRQTHPRQLRWSQKNPRPQVASVRLKPRTPTTGESTANGSLGFASRGRRDLRIPVATTAPSRQSGRAFDYGHAARVGLASGHEEIDIHSGDGRCCLDDVRALRQIVGPSNGKQLSGSVCGKVGPVSGHCPSAKTIWFSTSD